MAMRTRLPSRFPVGTHYIVEGEPAASGRLRIVARYVIMPNGKRYDLMTPPKRARKPAKLTRGGRVAPRPRVQRDSGVQLHGS